MLFSVLGKVDGVIYVDVKGTIPNTYQILSHRQYLFQRMAQVDTDACSPVERRIEQKKKKHLSK